MSNQPTPFHLLVRLKKDEDNIRLSCSPVRIEGGAIRYGESFDDQPSLKGLQTTASVYPEDWMGFTEFWYKDVYRVYAGNAAFMAKALAGYDKKLVKVYDQNGPAANVGQGVQWVSLALEAAGIVVEDETADWQPAIFSNGHIASEINRRVALLQGDQNHG